MFFDLLFSPCLSNCKSSRQDHLNRKLQVLKAIRDSLETRLAATNAAIDSIERQVSDAGEVSGAEAT